MADPRAEVQRAIWEAEPARLAAAAVATIDAWLGTGSAEILLIDYHQSHLVPLAGEGTAVTAVPVDGHPAGRAYASSRPFAHQDRLYIPLSVHGERYGVLSVRLPPGAPATADDVADVAATLTRALVIANTATDIYREVRRRKRLTVAAEMQWDLLPGRTCQSDEFRLAGQLEPAYAVAGDNFDWTISPDHLSLSVTNGTGAGLDAALLTQLAVTALRNARRSGAGPAESAELANGIVYSQYGGEAHSATLLLRIALATGEAEVVDAGSPRLLRIRRGGVERVGFDEQLPLGMFSDTQYRAQRLELRAGDRLVILSDGVYEARSPAGHVYGVGPLSAALRRSRLQDPAEAVRFLISDLITHHEGAEMGDDAIAMCLDWTGPAGKDAG